MLLLQVWELQIWDKQAEAADSSTLNYAVNRVYFQLLSCCSASWERETKANSVTML